MSNSALSKGTNQSTDSLDRGQLHLSLHHVTILVRDQDRSLRFYLDQLGFNLVVDARMESGDRWVAVAPPDGTAILALVAPEPDSEEYKFIGRSTDIIFVTEDVTAKFQEWSKRGVSFHHPPQTPRWGGIYTRFEDLDGNSFGLAGRDEVSHSKSKHNAALLPRSWKRNAGPTRNSKLQNRYKQGSFPKHCRRCARSTMQVFAFRLARSAATTTIFSISAGNSSGC